MLSSIEFANKLFENGISLKEANELICDVKFGNCIVLKLKLEEHGGINIIFKVEDFNFILDNDILLDYILKAKKRQKVFGNY